MQHNDMEYALVTMKRGNQLNSCRERFLYETTEQELRNNILEVYKNNSIERLREKHDLIFWRKPLRMRKSNTLQLFRYLNCPGGLKEYKKELADIYYRMRYAGRYKGEVVEPGTPFDKDPDFVVQTDEGEKFVFLDYHEFADKNVKTWLIDLDEDVLIYKEAGKTIEIYTRDSIKQVVI